MIINDFKKYILHQYYIHRSVGRCSVPTGLEDKRIRDGAMTASTYYNRYLAPWHGRINHRWSWSARRSVRNQWLQVYFGVLARLTGMLSQGRQDANQWVKTFILTFSRDGIKFVKYPKVKCSSAIKGHVRSNTRDSVLTILIQLCNPLCWNRYMVEFYLRLL